MTHNVVTIADDAPIEQAASIMVSRKIGGMPVLNAAGDIVGVITETDIFKAFVELLGGEEQGLRLTLEVPAGGGILAKLSQAIFDLGGNILSVGSLDREQDGKRELIVKVRDVPQQELIDVLESLGDHVIDAREV